MKNILQKSVGLVGLLIMTSVSAQSSPAAPTSLSVGGTITPAPCELAFGNNGTFDFGQIGAAGLNRDRATPLPEQQVDLIVSCGAASKVAVLFTDERRGTASASMDGDDYGLGRVGSSPIGYYVLKVDGTGTLDNTAGAGLIRTSDGGKTWQRNPTTLSPKNMDFYAWARANAPQTPASARLFTTKVTVAPSIAPTNTLDMTKDIKLDGLAKATLIYL